VFFLWLTVSLESKCIILFFCIICATMSNKHSCLWSWKYICPKPLKNQTWWHTFYSSSIPCMIACFQAWEGLFLCMLHRSTYVEHFSTHIWWFWSIYILLFNIYNGSTLDCHVHIDYYPSYVAFISVHVVYMYLLFAHTLGAVLVWVIVSQVCWRLSSYMA